MLVVHSSDEMYGADRMVLQVVTVLRDDIGEDVVTWVPSDAAASGSRLSDALARAGHSVERRPLPVLRRSVLTVGGAPGLAARLVTLVRDIRRLRPAVVYCTTSACLLVALAARMAGCRRVVLHNQEMWRPRERVVLALLAMLCRHVLCISHPVRAAMPRWVRRRAIVLLNGVPDGGRGVPVSAEGGQLVFLVASRWNAWKGHSTLLRAWQSAAAPGRLVVLGGPPPAGDGVDVRALVERMPCADSIEIVGEVEDIDPYLDACDVVVMPSDAPEPFGLVAIEAFARGRAVLATAGGGLAEVVEDGVTGWLVPRGDWRAMADRLVSLDREQVAAASVAARHVFESRFSADRFRSELAGVWRSRVSQP